MISAKPQWLKFELNQGVDRFRASSLPNLSRDSRSAFAAETRIYQPNSKARLCNDISCHFNSNTHLRGVCIPALMFTVHQKTSIGPFTARITHDLCVSARDSYFIECVLNRAKYAGEHISLPPRYISYRYQRDELHEDAHLRLPASQRPGGRLILLRRSCRPHQGEVRRAGTSRSSLASSSRRGRNNESKWRGARLISISPAGVHPDELFIRSSPSANYCH